MYEIRALSEAARTELTESADGAAPQTGAGPLILAIASLAAHLRLEAPDSQRVIRLAAAALARLAQVVAREAQAPVAESLDTLRIVQESRYREGAGAAGATWIFRDPRELLVSALDRGVDLAAASIERQGDRAGAGLLCAAADTANLVTFAVARCGALPVTSSDLPSLPALSEEVSW